jgi:polyisoprenyl-phosphate glycosyltransferase
MQPKTLSIVLPCFNEQEVLPSTLAVLDRQLRHMIHEGLISTQSMICCVDDGSTDETWSHIARFASTNSLVRGIKLSANYGHQAALLAGLLSAHEDMVISMDADLQDDVAMIPLMVRHHLAGAEIVYGVRTSREVDSFFKRTSANIYYALLSNLGAKLIKDHADFRLLGRNALDALAKYQEVNLFLRGLVPQLGFTVARVEYVRQKRVAGQTKYPFTKMLALAWEGVSSFSAKPLRWIFLSGVCVAVIAFVLAVWAVSVALFTNHAVPGWASVTAPLFFLGGVQLLSLGIIGEYIGKIYLEAKRRPRYHVEEMV